MKYACLFSGIGAPLQAAYRVYENVEHVFSCEYDKFARQSFKAIYGIDDEHFHKDVREMDGREYRGKVDVLVGGSPCQSFSIAGLREGTADQRGQLIYQYVRIVEEVKAPVIVYENVKGFLSITTLEYPQINHEELLWQEINQNISSSSKIMLGKYLLGKCAEYLTLKNIKSDISQIRNLASTLEKWENVVLIGIMKKLQSYLTQIKQTMKKQSSFQQGQIQLLECKEEDLDFLLSQLSLIENLSMEVINLLDIMGDMKKNQDLLFPTKLEELLQKMMLFIMSMEESMITQSKTYAYVMGKLNTLISIINLWKSSQNLWTEILSISISQISNIKSKLVFGEFIQALRDIGYFCHYEVINSKDYGIPQNRERVFIVGFLDHEDYYRFQFAPKQPLTKRLKDVLEPIVDEKYYLSETAIKGFQTHAETVASSVTTKAGGRPDDNFVKVIGKLDCKGDDYIKRVYDDEGIRPCLLTMQGGGQEPKIICDGLIPSRGENGLIHNVGGINKALKATEYKAPSLISEAYRIRKLTPLECWRLQDFPDEAHEKAKAAGISDAQRYKQAGNAMSCSVVEMIFRQIEKAKEKDPQSLF